MVKREELIESHPNFLYTFMNEEELGMELKNWSRERLIDWLCWNDRNGIYRDKESLSELGNVMTYEEGVEIMMRQILENQEVS